MLGVLTVWWPASFWLQWTMAEGTVHDGSPAQFPTKPTEETKKRKMYAIKQIKICAEYLDMLSRPRLDLSGTPGLRPIGLSPGSWQTSLGLGGMSRYSAQILICITHNQPWLITVLISFQNIWFIAYNSLLIKHKLKFEMTAIAVYVAISRSFSSHCGERLCHIFGRQWCVIELCRSIRLAFIVCYIMHAWWRHPMETFSALLAFCAGNSPVPVNYPHKCQWRGALMFFLICAWINDWVFETPSWSLWRQCNVMYMTSCLMQYVT